MNPDTNPNKREFTPADEAIFLKDATHDCKFDLSRLVDQLFDLLNHFSNRFPSSPPIKR
jgi:hypothetical protein